MSFRILVNRTTAHITGFEVKPGTSQWTLNHCAAVTRSTLAQTGKAHDKIEDAVKAAKAARAKVCKNCLKAAEAEIQAELDYQDRLAASLMPATESHDLGYVDPTAPAVVSAVVLPEGVWMEQDGSRILRGKVGHMLALMDSGLAVLTEDGDLVLR